MFTLETTDLKEMRRLRIAQFNGRSATVREAGLAITGQVRSIVDRKSSGAAAWVITIIPNPPAARPAMQRPAPRVRSFAERGY